MSPVGTPLQEGQALLSVRVGLHTHFGSQSKEETPTQVGWKKAGYLTKRKTKTPTSVNCGTVRSQEEWNFLSLSRKGVS